MEYAMKELGITSLDDWYTVSTPKMQRTRIAGLVSKTYAGSLRRALAAVFPEHDWLEWKFSRLAPRWINDPQNARRCVDWLGKQLGLQSISDWYSVSQADVHRHLKAFKSTRSNKMMSLADLVMLAYPSHDWQQWRFNTGVDAGFWNDKANQRRFCDWIATQLSIKKDSDWLNVTTADFLKHGGYTLVNNLYDGSVIALVKSVYPERPWSEIVGE